MNYVNELCTDKTPTREENDPWLELREENYLS